MKMAALPQPAAEAMPMLPITTMKRSHCSTFCAQAALLWLAAAMICCDENAALLARAAAADCAALASCCAFAACDAEQKIAMEFDQCFFDR